MIETPVLDLSIVDVTGFTAGGLRNADDPDMAECRGGDQCGGGGGPCMDCYAPRP